MALRRRISADYADYADLEITQAGRQQKAVSRKKAAESRQQKAGSRKQATEGIQQKAGRQAVDAFLLSATAILLAAFCLLPPAYFLSCNLCNLMRNLRILRPSRGLDFKKKHYRATKYFLTPSVSRSICSVFGQILARALRQLWRRPAIRSQLGNQADEAAAK